MSGFQRAAVTAAVLFLAASCVAGQNWQYTSSVVEGTGSTQTSVSTSEPVSGTSSPKPSGWAVTARDSPLAFFSLLSTMDKQMQHEYLKLVGAKAQASYGLECNVFGGAESCMALSRDSDFGRLCPDHDMQVDCAYYTDDTIEIDEDPIAAVKNSMQSKGLGDLEAACPTCFNNQRALWCAQTVPKCGSYSSVIEDMVLPVITKVTKAVDMGDSVIEALSTVVPQLLEASSLTMPCREMCEAIVTSCSCDSEQKFGELLDDYVASSNVLSRHLPEGFTSHLFGHVYNTPICSLYGNTSDPRFKGSCTLPTSTTCENRQAWCADTTAATQVQELMAGQVAQALFGWVDSPVNNLFDDGREIIDDSDDTREDQLVSKFVKQGGSTDQDFHSSSAGVLAHWLVIAAFVAVVAVAVAAVVRMKFLQRRMNEGYYAMRASPDQDDAGQAMVSQSRSHSESA